MSNSKNKNEAAQLMEYAFKELHAPLYFYAFKFVNRPDIAKDLVQDAFLSILNSAKTIKIDNLKAYLFKTVRNNCLDFLKHQDVKSKYVEVELERTKRELEFYDDHSTLVEKDLWQKLNEAIEELPEKYKVPLKLSRLEELKTKEIAEKLDLPVRTIETQLYRALKIVRKKLKEQGLILFNLFYTQKTLKN